MLRTSRGYLERLAGSRLNHSRRGSDICAERVGRALTYYRPADAFAPEADIYASPTELLVMPLTGPMRRDCHR
jgi:hypothetical protein